MTLRPDIFFNELNRLFPRADFLIAYSGGLDSTVLVHLCAQGAAEENRGRLLAVNVNHGIHPQSGHWAVHCKTTCAGLDVRCRVLSLNLVAKPVRNLEETARTARYDALLRLMTEGTVLLTAQHRDDQAETILLQLLRGGGLQGLSGMPESIAFGPGILHRPLLKVSRSSIQAYADLHGLKWIDDPSNLDTVHDRNYLRHEIIPRIRSRWPGMDKTLARSGKHCAEAQKIVDAQGESWFESVIERSRNTILISKLSEFDEARKRLILRHWIRRSGYRSPSQVKLQRIISEAIPAARDRFPRIQWDEAEVRRYRDKLYLLTPIGKFDRDRVTRWSICSPLPIPELSGTLECRSPDRHPDFPTKDVSVRFRKGGERCRLPGRQGTRSLKKVFQELAVPPWERDRIPLIYFKDELAAIGDRLVCAPFHELGLEFRWIREGSSRSESAFASLQFDYGEPAPG
ncbi:MAG: tRNA lysidine(34) synthetase TilS [Methylococcaceae bacterium]|nr:tRNA lysidine(34) synthetase TilS [Methylococcaceae bacterium]